MTDEEIASLFEHLYQRSIVNLVTIEKRPSLLAHYTSLEVLEKIMTNNEIWFSNPLFMNDLQEVRFGMGEGLKAFNEFARTPQFLEACGGSQEKAEMIRTAFHAYFVQFDAEHVLDVYVFCLSEHDPDNRRRWAGVRSMNAAADHLMIHSSSRAKTTARTIGITAAMVGLLAAQTRSSRAVQNVQ